MYGVGCEAGSGVSLAGEGERDKPFWMRRGVVPGVSVPCDVLMLSGRELMLV